MTLPAENGCRGILDDQTRESKWQEWMTKGKREQKEIEKNKNTAQRIAQERTGGLRPRKQNE
jgi:hypothetical protein